MSDYLNRDRRAVLHSQQRRVPDDRQIVWVRGRGATLYDADGRAYLDGLSGLWNVLVGHGREELVAAAARQMRELAFASSFAGETHPRAIELAERLQSLTYGAGWRFFFTCGGAEALEAAFRTARYVQHRRGKAKKNGFLTYDRAYHGTTIATASAGGNAAYRKPFAPDAPGFYTASTPGVGDGELGNQSIGLGKPRAVLADRASGGAHTATQAGAASCGDAMSTGAHSASNTRGFPSPSPPSPAPLDRLEQRIVEIGPERLAGIVAEPVWAPGGTYAPPSGYWRGVRALCDRYDLLFIADEIVTAFGRCGDWTALQAQHVVPDIFCFAKGVTSGYFPFGGMGVSPTIGELIDDANEDEIWRHALTNSAHPVGCAVALANIEILERERLIPRAVELCERLDRELRTAFADDPRVSEIRRYGLLAGIEFVPRAEETMESNEHGPSAAVQTGRRLLQAARARGLTSRVSGSTFQLAPPYVTTDEELRAMVVILRQAADDALGSQPG